MPENYAKNERAEANDQTENLESDGGQLQHLGNGSGGRRDGWRCAPPDHPLCGKSDNGRALDGEEDARISVSAAGAGLLGGRFLLRGRWIGDSDVGNDLARDGEREYQ
ncbi:MAG: hypothetical protein WA192_14555 [Candidatus Acidiferrales bacterium]